MKQYELMYVLRTDMDEQATKEAIEKFNTIITAGGGTIDKTEEMGKRRLAYPIDYQLDGYYVLQYFTSGPDLPRELERNFKISENVLRYMVHKAFVPAAKAAKPAEKVAE